MKILQKAPSFEPRHQANLIAVFLRSRTARNSYLNLLGLAAPLLVGLFLVPVTLHGLGPARYGLLSLALTVLEYSGLFSLGLGPATTKHVAASIANKDQGTSGLILISIAANAFLGTIGCIAVVLLAPFLANIVFHVPDALRHEAVTAFRLIGLMVPTSLVLLCLFGALEGASRFGIVNAVRIPVSTLSFVIPAVEVARGGGLVLIMSSLVVFRLVVCVTLLLVVALSIDGFRWQFPRDWRGIKSLFSFGAWLSVSNVVSPTLIYADRFMLGALRGLSAVGFYSAPFDAVMRILMIPGSLSRTIFPAMSALRETSNYDQLLPLFRKAVTAVVLLTAGPVVILLLFAPQILGLWLGSSVASFAGNAARILAVGLLFNSAALIPSTVLSAIGRPDINAKFHVLESLVHLPIAWWLVSRYGIVGAASAWTFRVALDSILLFIASWRILTLLSRDPNAGTESASGTRAPMTVTASS